MKRRIYIIYIINQTGLKNLESELGTELELLQKDGNEIEDVTIFPDTHHYGDYIAIIKYSYVS